MTSRLDPLAALVAACACAGFAGPPPAAAQPPSVLVFTATAGFRHDAIPAAVTAITSLAAAHGVTVTHTEDPSTFTDDGLRQHGAVAFLLTSGDVLSPSQEAALERFVTAGGGFLGVHSASDTEYAWPFYRTLVGAYFQSHPAIQQATIRVEGTHASTTGLAANWVRVDEWYNFDANPRPDVHVLATLDESTYSGGTMGADHPIAWYRQVSRGRAWYTALGHTASTYSEPAFLDHLSGGLRWALGRQKHRDADGDGLADLTVFRPATGVWYHARSRDASTARRWGAPGDLPVSGDYDGDGIGDDAVWRPSDGGWYIVASSGGAQATTWGTGDDVPVPADYDGDGRTDVAVFRPGSPAAFYIVGSRDGPTAVTWGTLGDVPVPADYDGDGRTDVAVFRAGGPAAFFVRSSAAAASYAVAWGVTGDVPVPADYDGDGRADVAVFRPSSGTWFVVGSASPAAVGWNWGSAGDVPAPRDTDGDGRADLVVFRPGSGAWFVARTRGGAVGVGWGQAGDLVP